MKQRILTAVLLLPVAIAAVLLLPSPWFMALAAAVLLVGLWEWTRLSGVTGTATRLLLVGAHAALLAALARYGWPQLFAPIALGGVLWWLLALAWLFRFGFGANLGRRRNRVLALLSGTLAVVPAWCALALLHTGPLGPRWTLFAVALVWAADTGAYFAGRRFGARTPKLAPRISPAKTWAGVGGGLLASMLLAAAVAPLLDVAWGELAQLLALALVAAIASIVGDLFESLLKRHAGAKDSSALIPGHGGVLDRMDSLLAALPVFAVGRSLLGL
jgi:phosphatidate cytidylyltransferase